MSWLCSRPYAVGHPNLTTAMSSSLHVVVSSSIADSGVRFYPFRSFCSASQLINHQAGPWELLSFRISSCGFHSGFGVCKCHYSATDAYLGFSSLDLLDLIRLPNTSAVMEQKSVEAHKLKMHLRTEVKSSLNIHSPSTPCVLEPNLL